MAAPWLGEALRAGGLPVIEEPGCMDRGTGGLFTPLGVLMHHTAGGANGNLPSLGIVRDGRSDLQGPLSQLMLARDGTFHFIAAGRANHAGVGSAWFVPGGDGNRYLVGVEAESTGIRDDWTDAQRVNYPRGVAALLSWMGKDERYAIGHKEWAPTRKVDPAFWDMGAFRADVRNWLNGRDEDMGLTPDEQKYFNTRFGDLWMRFGVRPDGKDRLTDIWVEELATRNTLCKRVDTLDAKLDGLTATINTLAELLAAGSNDLTADAVKAAVAEAIAQAVEFDVTMTPRASDDDQAA